MQLFVNFRFSISRRYGMRLKPRTLTPTTAHGYYHLAYWIFRHGQLQAFTARGFESVGNDFGASFLWIQKAT